MQSGFGLHFPVAAELSLFNITGIRIARCKITVTMRFAIVVLA